LSNQVLIFFEFSIACNLLFRYLFLGAKTPYLKCDLI
jgi:hypothetical protein